MSAAVAGAIYYSSVMRRNTFIVSDDNIPIENDLVMKKGKIIKDKAEFISASFDEDNNCKLIMLRTVNKRLWFFPFIKRLAKEKYVINFSGVSFEIITNVENGKSNYYDISYTTKKKRNGINYNRPHYFKLHIKNENNVKYHVN
jgi:hypothetical protein